MPRKRRRPDIWKFLFLMSVACSITAFAILSSSYYVGFVSLEHSLSLSRSYNLQLEDAVSYLEGELLISQYELNRVNMLSNNTNSEAYNWQVSYYACLADLKLQQFELQRYEAAVPFAAVAEDLSFEHEYVRNVYDCTQFSEACVSAFQKMGYSARQKIVNVNPDVFNCSSCRHMIAMVQVPVDCTPPYAHIIPPSEFWAYGLADK
jgi:hypothetical protein